MSTTAQSRTLGDARSLRRAVMERAAGGDPVGPAVIVLRLPVAIVAGAAARDGLVSAGGRDVVRIRHRQKLL